MIEKSTSKSITIAKTKFISRDSFAGRRSDPLSLNLYTYCRNNPIRYIDPSGHDAVAAAQYKVDNNLNGSRPTKCNSDWDYKLMKKWDKYYEILSEPAHVNSNGDYVLRNKTINGVKYNLQSSADYRYNEKTIKLNKAFKEACNTLVAREGTGNGDRRTNATITINTLSGSVYNYLGSTLPTDPNGNFATINEAKYIITKWTNDYKGHGAPAYHICNLDGTDGIPSYYPDHIGPNGDGKAVYFLLHQAGYASNWSEGCITVVGENKGIKEMTEVSNLIDDNNIGYIQIIR